MDSWIHRPFPIFSHPFPHSFHKLSPCFPAFFPILPTFSPRFPGISWASQPGARGHWRLRGARRDPLGAGAAEDAQRQNHAPRAAEVGAAGLPDAGGMDFNVANWKDPPFLILLMGKSTINGHFQ